MQDLEAFHRALEELQDRVGYRFADTQLLIEALTHSSFANQAQLGYCNERLEFLGDSKAGAMCGGGALLAAPLREGGAAHQAKVHGGLEPQPGLLRQGPRAGPGPPGGKAIKKGGPLEGMVADAMEALIGAVYLDGGWRPPGDRKPPRVP